MSNTQTAGKILQDDEDFLVEVIDWQGRLAVRKSVKTTTRPERLERLKNEAYGLKYFTDLAAKHPEINVYVPILYEVKPEFIVTEYIEQPSVGDKPQNLNKLARLLAQIDHIEPYGKAKIHPSFDYMDIRKRFPLWYMPTINSKPKKLLTDAQISRVNKILDRYQPYLTPRIAHGDLSPYFHAFMMPNNKIAFVDLEVFTPRGARYYDVARCYTRLYEKAPSTDAPKQFLSAFMQYADEIQHRNEQLMAILIQRTVGMQRDAGIDKTKGRDYRNRAAELLDLVLQNKLELLKA
ncbi:MAG: phosphotransferase [Candidatus Saccharimonadales bacterium]